MTDKVIAITGASSGIGEASARLLAKSGARLVLGARRREKLEGVAAEIEAAGGTAIPVDLDVTSRESMEAFVATAIDRFGRVDVLVNNAGVMQLGPLFDLRVDEWERMIDVNLKGVLYGMAAVLPHMKAQDSGHIVFVASTAGIRTTTSMGVYSGTKFAVRAVAEGLRLEGGTAIRSTIICPGSVQTELFQNVANDRLREITLSRLAQALPVDSIARAIDFAIAQPPEVDVNEIVVRPMFDKY